MKGLWELIKWSTKEKCFDLLSNSNDLSVADQGEPGSPPPPPVIFGWNWGPEGWKKFFLRSVPPLTLSQGLDDRPLPPYLKVWIHHCLFLRKCTGISLDQFGEFVCEYWGLTLNGLNQQIRVKICAKQSTYAMPRCTRHVLRLRHVCLRKNCLACKNNCCL